MLDAYVTLLARETHWDREYILWQLPYAAGLRIRCCMLYLRGAWVVPVAPPAPEIHDAQVDALLA